MKKELFKLTMELAQSIRELQKAQAKVEYRNRELLRYIGRHIGCDFESSLRMWECYQKGILQGTNTLDELYESICK